MRILVIHCTYQQMVGDDKVVADEVSLLRSKGNKVDLLLFYNTLNPAFTLLQLPFNIGSYLATEHKIREFKPDVVHIHNLHSGGSASVIYAIKKRVPIVYTLHNYRLIGPSGTLFNSVKLFFSSLSTSFSTDAVFEKVYKRAFR